jgi:hypothetical protein
MPRVYRISRPGREPITDVDSIEGVKVKARPRHP